MKNKSLLVVYLIALLGMAAFPAHADEELFDTKAAAQHIDKGITYIKAKNFDAAITEFEAAAEINPDAEAYYYLGYTYYLKGRSGDKESRSKSRENFDRAYDIDPNFTPTRYKPTEPAPAAVQQSEQPEPSTSSAPSSTTTAPAPDKPQQAQPAPPADQHKE